jgi:exonuclease III
MVNQRRIVDIPRSANHPDRYYTGFEPRYSLEDSGGGRRIDNWLSDGLENR